MSLVSRDGTCKFGAACRFKHIKLLRVCQALFLVQQRLGDCQVRRVYFVLQLGSACLYENFGHVCSWLSRAKAVQQLEYVKINFDGEGTIDSAMIVLLPMVACMVLFEQCLSVGIVMWLAMP